MPDLIDYRVRPITRFLVTRYERTGDAPDPNSARSSFHGEFDSEQMAYAVAYALCRKEHGDLGWPLGDERIQYPDPIPERDPA